MALQRTIDKWKLKKWFNVYAPKSFNESKICEIPASDEKQVANRTIRVSLDQLTRNPQHAFTNVVLRITDVNGDAAHTKLVMIEQVYSYVRSLVRRYRGVSTAVIPVVTRDNVGMVVKMIAVTRSRVTAARLRAIRKEMVEAVGAYAKGTDSGSMISSVIDGKFQMDVTGRVSHITPINKVEVRKLEVR